MKGIPADDLIYMLRATFSGAPYSVVIKDFLVKLMDVYGDDYFKHPGESPFELIQENESRKSYMVNEGTTRCLELIGGWERIEALKDKLKVEISEGEESK